MKYLSKEGLGYLVTKIKSIFATKEELENLEYDSLKNKPSFKTINSQSILGSGNILISGGGTQNVTDLGYFYDLRWIINDVITNSRTSGLYIAKLGDDFYHQNLFINLVRNSDGQTDEENGYFITVMMNNATYYYVELGLMGQMRTVLELDFKTLMSPMQI